MSDVEKNHNSQPRLEDPGSTLSFSTLAKELGSHIGPYKLLSILGEGGFGIVYLAEQESPIKRRVAIKVIKPGMDSKQVIARFEAERQALALLDHPNIAHVFDAGRTDAGRPYFVMEHVKGISITEYCDQEKYSIEQRLELFQLVCDAIQHAHQKGIIHRDIKPSNILVSVLEGRAVPVVIDFGVAKAVSQPLTERTLFTEQGQMIGTPEYMSPEQADMSVQEIDTRSDIYSLGVVLYELLTGTLPFDTKSLREIGIDYIRRVIREQEPKTPSTRLSSLGETAADIAKKRQTDIGTLTKRLHKELEWIPLKAIRKESSRRYRSASELGEDIRHYLNGDPLLAGPESAAYRLKKTVTRHRALVTGIVAVLVVLTVGVIVSTHFAIKATQAQRAERDQRLAAEDERKEADRARQGEQRQKEITERALEDAEARAEELQMASYSSNIQLADMMLEDGFIHRAAHLLETCPNDCRGWEWHYLNNILDSTGTTYGRSPASFGNSCISPNGLVAFCTGSSVVLWDIETASESMVLSDHSAKVGSVGFSPDGSLAISCSIDGMMKVWNTETGASVAEFTSYEEALRAVPMSVQNANPQYIQRLKDRQASQLRGSSLVGSRVIDLNQSGTRTISCDLAGAYLWDMQTGKVLGLFTDFKTSRRIESVLYSPDCERILTLEYSALKLWDADGKNLVIKSGGYSAGTFSPDSSLLAYFGRDLLYVCDATSGDEKHSLATSFRPLVSAIDPTNTYIAGGDVGGRIRVWNIVSGEEELLINAHKTRVASIAFNKAGTKLVSVSRDGEIGLWTISKMDARQPQIILTGRTSAGTIALSSDGRLAAAMWNEKVTILDIEHGSEVDSFFRPYVPGPMFFSVDVSASGNLVAWDVQHVTGLPTGNTSTLEIENPKKPERTVELETNNLVSAIAFDANDKFLASGHKGGIDIWDLSNGKKLRTCGYKDAGRRADDIAFHPKGRSVCACSGRYKTSGVVAVWDLIDGKCQWEITSDKGVVSVGFSPDGKYIASGKTDGVVEILDASTGKEILSFYHGGVVKAISYSSDGKDIISGSSHGTIKIWDALLGFEKLTLHVPGKATVEAVVLNSDEKQLVAGCIPIKILVWKSQGHDHIDAVSEPLVQTRMRLKPGMDRPRVVYDRVAEYYTKAILSDSNNPQSFYQRAIAFSGKKKLNDAIADVSAAIALNADNPDYWQLRACLYDKIHDYDRAIGDLTRIIQMDPNDSRAYYERGLGLYKAEQYEKAIEDFNAAITLNIQDPHNWYRREQARRKTRALRKIVAENAPTVDSQLLNKLASLYATCPTDSIRNGEKAVELATKACELTLWSDADYIGTLASAYAESGDYESAIEVQEKIIILDAKSRDGHILKEHEDQFKVYIDALIKGRAVITRGDDVGDSAQHTLAWAPIPPRGKKFTGFSPTVELTWSRGENTVQENVNFGADPNSLNLLRSLHKSGSVASPQLEAHCRYYWRVDGIKADGSTILGETWSFTTGMPDTMLCHLKFDSDFSDSSGHELHGTAAGDAKIVTDPQRGDVLSLDGNGDWIDCGNDRKFNIIRDITISAWIRINKFNRDWQAIITKGDSAWRLTRKASTNVLAFHCTGIKSSSEESWGGASHHLGVEGRLDINDGKWHHIASVYDGKRIYLYVDGALDNSEEATGFIDSNNKPVYIGGNSEEVGRYWSGLIDNVRVYNYALDANEVQVLYKGELR